jgi:hypothetical protein
MSQTTRSPSGNVDALETDVTDESELRETLLRLVDDARARDLETMDDRLCGLLSDVRRARATETQDGGDA